MKTYQERKNFTFVSKGLAEDAFEVVRFSGTEAISRPYEFTVTLSAKDADIDLKGVLRNPATLTIVRDEEKIPIHGVLAAFEQLHEANQRIFYRAVLVPKLWYMGLSRENRLFLDKSVPQMIEEVLKQGGLTTQDYELKTTRSYPAWEYVCQYRESNLDFISRWMEREGIYYFFKQAEAGEKLVITDSSTVHENIHGESTIPYSPAAGLIPEDEEIVTGFVCRQNVLPKKVIVKDYNYRKPTLEEKAEADVDPNGRQEVYIYGEHFKDPSQGKELASIRAGEFLCRETIYYGEATSPRLAPGFLFQLAKHYRGSSNRRFLVTEVEHRGVGAGVLLSGMSQDQAQGEMEPGYSNHFVCIPAEVQFRPERKTPKPRFNGTMNAVVDAAGDGSTAQLDDQGRYKVILPFDLSGRKSGKASRWIRMAQPYSGSDYGTHFPLHKGSEVLLTFIDGDIDRPIISSAAPNPHTKSPVTSANETQSVIRDNFGNEIVMDATPGDEHILLHSPHHGSSIQIGRSVATRTDSDQFRATMGNQIEAMVGVDLSAVLGSNIDAVIGSSGELTLGQKYTAALGGTHEFSWGYDWLVSKGPKRDIADEDMNLISEKDNIVSADGVLCLIGGAGESKEAGAPKEAGVLKEVEGSTSVIRAAEHAISLTIGHKAPPLGRAASRELHILAGLAGAFALASATLVALATSKVANDRVEKAWGEKFGRGAMAAFLMQTVTMAWLKRRMEHPDNAPKAVSHQTTAARIEMGREGYIDINSNGKIKQTVLSVGDYIRELEGKDEKEVREKKLATKRDYATKVALQQPYEGIANICIKCHGSQIVVEESKVTIQGERINIESRGELTLQSTRLGSKLTLQANGTISGNTNLAIKR